MCRLGEADRLNCLTVELAAIHEQGVGMIGHARIFVDATLIKCSAEIFLV